MSVTVVYKPESDHARTVEDFLRDFTRQTGTELTVLDPDTSDGTAFCRVYDIVEYPTIIAVTTEGQLLNNWRGLPLPTISEVSYYTQ